MQLVGNKTRIQTWLDKPGASLSLPTRYYKVNPQLIANKSLLFSLGQVLYRHPGPWPMPCRADLRMPLVCTPYISHSVRSLGRGDPWLPCRPDPALTGTDVSFTSTSSLCRYFSEQAPGGAPVDPTARDITSGVQLPAPEPTTGTVPVHYLARVDLDAGSEGWGRVTSDCTGRLISNPNPNPIRFSQNFGFADNLWSQFGCCGRHARVYQAHRLLLVKEVWL